MAASLPRIESAESLTAWMQSGWNLVAFETVSVRHSRDRGNAGVEPANSPSTSVPRAKRSKSRRSSFSSFSTVSSDGDRMSREKLTWPGIVLVLPGVRLRIPVEARVLCLVANRWEWVINRAARRRASARSAKGVEPVCASTSLAWSSSCTGTYLVQ